MCRTKHLVWDSSPNFPFAICSSSSTYASARMQDPFIAQSNDSIAVNPIWCLPCMHPLLRWENGTEGFGVVYGQKCRIRSAKAFPEPHLTWQVSLWKPSQASLGQSTAAPTFLHCTTLLGNSIFQTQAKTEAKSQAQCFRGELRARLLSGPREHRRSSWTVQHAAADPACLDVELLHHREDSNLF